MFLKILAGIVIFVVAIVATGLSGLAFYIWPTSLNDHKLSLTPNVIQRLRSLQSEHKFDHDVASAYPGAMNEVQRQEAQAAVDTAIQTLIIALPARPQRSTVLSVMKRALANFDSPESEERDQLLVYFENIMSICGVESSGELLNVWRYGFPYGWFR